ncbi:uncharacterized protein LOC143277026 [Babylonia areolata]|uniref:uncharacterized protein LOC143277026 n=1 Tax=Babylonia areolata TaxID=304850 RepID=UPI003FD5AD1B
MAGFNCSPVGHVTNGLIQLTICLIFNIVICVMPNWVQFSVGGVDVKFGLWEYCISGNCASLPDNLDTAQMRAARAFNILGMMTVLGAIVPAVMYLCKRNGRHILPAAISAAVGSLFIMIAFVLAVDQANDVSKHRGFCFGLGLSSIFQAFFGGIAFFGAHCSHGSSC